MPRKAWKNSDSLAQDVDVVPALNKKVTGQFVTDTIEEVIASILDTISIEINKSIEKLKTPIINNLVNENKKLSARLTELESRTSKLLDGVDDLEDEIEHFHDRMYENEVGLFDQQQRSRRNNIELCGVPDDILNENLETSCIEILKLVVDEPIYPDEIEACHRLPSRGTKPIIMRFAHRKRRDEIIHCSSQINEADPSRFGVKENGKIYINEGLSPYMKTLSYYCRKLKRARCITKFNMEKGHLKIKTVDNKPWIKITHEQDLERLFPNFDFD